MKTWNSAKTSKPPPKGPGRPRNAQHIGASHVTPELLAYAMPGGFASYCSNGTWVYARHLKYIEDKLLDVVDGKIKRLIISIPPQNGKSELISKYFTAWYLGRNPTKRVILTSYEATFAASWGRASRNLLEEYGKKVFGVEVSQRTHAGDHWEIYKHGGSMRTAGAGGGITGKGADLFIIDDPVKNHSEALSAARQDEIWTWYRATMRTRLGPTCAVVLVMTRWANDDLAGRLILQGKRINKPWEYVCLPALAEKDDPLGRPLDEPLWPERYSYEWLDEQKQVMMDFWWNSQYQQRPAPREGYIINVDWFRRYEGIPEREAVSEIILSFDTAQKEQEINDYTVCTVWYVYDHAYYLIDLIRDKFTHPKLIVVAKMLCMQWRPTSVLIEDKGSGTSLIQHLQKDTSFSIIAMTPTTDKVMRMQNESTAIQTGNVFIPEENTKVWVGDLLDEIRGFPNTPHKDQADSISQFLRYMREKREYRIEMW